MIGGETGIRTLGGVAPTTVFETAPFDHSGTSPRGSGGGRLVGFGGGIKGGVRDNAKTLGVPLWRARGLSILGKMKGAVCRGSCGVRGRAGAVRWFLTSRAR